MADSPALAAAASLPGPKAGAVLLTLDASLLPEPAVAAADGAAGSGDDSGSDSSLRDTALPPPAATLAAAAGAPALASGKKRSFKPLIGSEEAAALKAEKKARAALEKDSGGTR